MQPEQNLFFRDGHLTPCPGSPNCVNSEAEQGDSLIRPLAVTGSPEQAWLSLQAVIVDKGGSMEKVSQDYLHATFRSRIFRFVDDLVCRLDQENRVIHVRSSSRTGYADFGVNRKRVEIIRSELQRR